MADHELDKPSFVTALALFAAFGGGVFVTDRFPFLFWLGVLICFGTAVGTIWRYGKPLALRVVGQQGIPLPMWEAASVSVMLLIESVGSVYVAYSHRGDVDTSAKVIGAAIGALWESPFVRYFLIAAACLWLGSKWPRWRRSLSALFEDDAKTSAAIAAAVALLIFVFTAGLGVWAGFRQQRVLHKHDDAIYRISVLLGTKDQSDVGLYVAAYRIRAALLKTCTTIASKAPAECHIVLPQPKARPTAILPAPRPPASR